MPRFASVLFDCDSTLSAIEGIDVLATHHRGEIAELTDAAMRGDIPLEQVYGRRLALVRPTRARLEELGRQYIDAMVDDAREVVAALRDAQIAVRVISGGLLPAVRILARELGLDDRHVAAVDVRFDERGEFAGFDESSPLARSGGKRTIVEQWLPGLPEPVMLVGDGVTDLEARPLIECFVAFAGVVARDPVIEAADIVVRAPSLAPILTLALGGDPPTEPGHLAIFRKGASLLESPAFTPSVAPPHS
jgi:phosphoserine phosphatase